MPTICVIGPHSSGTRLMSRICRVGLAGHGWEIYHRSLPGSWPTRGVRYVWIERDPHCTMASQIANGHAKNPDQAHAQLAEARAIFYDKLTQGMNVITVHYSDLIANPDAVIKRVADWMEVEPWAMVEEVFDGDEPYRDVNLADVKVKPTVGHKVWTQTRGGQGPPGAGIGIPPVRVIGEINDG